MERTLKTIILLLFSTAVYSQVNFEIEGNARISQMDKVNTADSIVVRLNDGTLAIRDASTLAEYQIISISNDTIFLLNGGFVKLPSEVDGSTVNELQTISRVGLEVTLSDGGGTYQDSVNVYIAGSGIDISDNVVSSSPSEWFLGKDTLGGIVFYIYKGSDGLDHGLIVHKQESPLQWQNPTALINANRSWDGVYNMDLMPAASPAKTYVVGLGAGWYLPSIDELSLLSHSRFHVNKALINDMLSSLISSDAYWSSTEYDASFTWYFSFGIGDAGASNKTNTFIVRAIRSF